MSEATENKTMYFYKLYYMKMLLITPLFLTGFHLKFLIYLIATWLFKPLIIQAETF